MWIGMQIVIIMKCFSVGTPNILKFSFLPNGKLMSFMCPNVNVSTPGYTLGYNRENIIVITALFV